LESIRIFVGIKIPAELKDKIVEAQTLLRKTSADVKWVEPENFHYNLKFFGSVTESELKKVEHAIQNVAKNHDSFKLEIQDIGTFPTKTSPRVVWLGAKNGNSEIISLANALDSEFSKQGFAKGERPFTPHLTLGRIRSDLNMENLIKRAKDLEHINIGSFNVNELIIFQSKLSRNGPTYIELSKFSLGGE
jgi:2'-5' RNA ligase